VLSHGHAPSVLPLSFERLVSRATADTALSSAVIAVGQGPWRWMAAEAPP